jgi:hypothetical protein
MLLYLRTSKGDINTQNTGNRVGQIVNGNVHYNWAFPKSLEPYEIRRAQVEELGDDVGNMLLAVKVREDDDKETDIHIGIDGSFYQRSGKRVLDEYDINSTIASACPFPVGFRYLTIDKNAVFPSFGKWMLDGPCGYCSTGSNLGFGGSNTPIYVVTRTG